MRRFAAVLMTLGLVLALSTAATASPWHDRVKVDDLEISGNSWVNGNVHSDGTAIHGALNYYSEFFGYRINLVKPFCFIVDNGDVLIKGDAVVIDSGGLVAGHVWKPEEIYAIFTYDDSAQKANWRGSDDTLCEKEASTTGDVTGGSIRVMSR